MAQFPTCTLGNLSISADKPVEPNPFGQYSDKFLPSVTKSQHPLLFWQIGADSLDTHLMLDQINFGETGSRQSVFSLVLFVSDSRNREKIEDTECEIECNFVFENGAQLAPVERYRLAKRLVVDQ